METLDNCMEMPELLEVNEARSRLTVDHAEDVLRQYLQRCYLCKDDDDGDDYSLELLGLQLEDDDDDAAAQGSVDTQKQAQEILEHPIFSVGRKRFHEHPIYSILKKSFEALSEEDQMLFMDAALFRSPYSSHHRSWNINTLDWMHMVHGGSVEDIKERVKGLEDIAVVQSFDEESGEIGIHELWHEFAVVESNQESSPWFYDIHEDTHRARRFSGWENLQRAFIWRRSEGKEELNFSLCSNLTSLTLGKVPDELDLSPLKCLKYLELHSHGGPRSARVFGLGFLERLVVLGWFQIVAISPCLEEIGLLRSLQVLQLQFLPWEKTGSSKLEMDFSRLSLLQTFCLSGDDWSSRTTWSRDEVEFLRDDGSLEGYGTYHVYGDAYMLAGFQKLQSLQKLDISGCTGIKALPGLEELVALTELQAARCFNLEELPNLQKLQRLQKLDISFCVSMRALPGLDALEALLELDSWGCVKLGEFPNLQKLQKLQRLDIFVCSTIKAVPGLDDLVSLLELRVDGCTNLEELPNLQKLQKLKKLDISECPLIKALPGLDYLVALEEFRAFDCSNLAELPNMGKLTSLRVLNLKIPYFYEEYRLKYPSYFLEEDCDTSYLKIKPVSIKVVPGLEDLISLPKLTVDFRVFEGALDLCKLTKLTKVSLRGWSSQAAAGLASLPNLQVLKISYTDGLQLVEPAGISSLTGLRRLELNRCDFEDVSCLSSLMAFQHLQVKDHGDAQDGYLCLKKLLLSVLDLPSLRFTLYVDYGVHSSCWSYVCDELQRLQDRSLIVYKSKFDM
ncbi:hypothetical protein M758_6G070500 [Ceratodon purpureus]|nr:hypothetical protein M758_6G070500 [Ceratodon purpureus]